MESPQPSSNPGLSIISSGTVLDASSYNLTAQTIAPFTPNQALLKTDLERAAASIQTVDAGQVIQPPAAQSQDSPILFSQQFTPPPPQCPSHTKATVDSVTGLTKGSAIAQASPSREDEYLVGDWNGDGKDDIAVRRGSLILKDINGDGTHDLQQRYGLGNKDDEYLVGDWNGDGKDDIAIRRGSLILKDINGDGTHDLQQQYGLGRKENQYLVGDWNGDGKDDIAVRRGNLILKEINGDGVHDLQQRYGLGRKETEYLTGDWNGDGKDDIAVRRSSLILKEVSGDGKHDLQQQFGLGTALPDVPKPTPRPPRPIGPGATINREGLELVKSFEGLRLRAYRDPIGIWTIGYGHTGTDARPGNVITRQRAEALLKKDLQRFEKAVDRLVNVPLNSNQFSALVSFTFNLGEGKLATSTLRKRLNQRDYNGAANEFPKWVYAGGKQLPGLVRRRRAERALFLK